ncbi:MAG: hypothetical protein M3R24_22865 [Chloroflexota bacterium]|nr:hypothetical protein [Chloroflexota bacterium]PLS78702.1 MAG: hypothetical protein CYG59_17075 [Chloroflexota bacterium]
MRGRNRGGAVGALLLAGAAYAWRNRERLMQQFQSFRAQRSGTPDMSRPGALPDYSATEQRDFSPSRQELNDREFGGTRM